MMENRVFDKVYSYEELAIKLLNEKYQDSFEIEKVQSHSIFKGYSYDYDKREIELYCEYKYAEEKTDEMKFIFQYIRPYKKSQTAQYNQRH